jgi:putative tryptophan/tyrosine transport system substrate-binding protein
MPKTQIIALVHSGKSGNHDAHINAFNDALTLAMTTTNPTQRLPDAYAKDGDPKPYFDDAISKGATLLIAAGGTNCAKAAQLATKTVPIVFTTYADSTAPATNMTGICAQTSALDVKRLDFLFKALPKAKTFGVLYNSGRYNASAQNNLLKDEASNALKVNAPDFKSIDFGNAKAIEDQIDGVYSGWSGKVDGVIVCADPIFNNHRGDTSSKKKGLISIAAQYNIPTIYQWAEFPDNGGLISYGPNFKEGYTIAGVYAAHIVDGTSINNLKVLTLNPELVINLTTAKTLNTSIPDALLGQANRLITDKPPSLALSDRVSEFESLFRVFQYEIVRRRR